MRPRVFPAEDISLACLMSEEKSASMRPRVFPAEDLLNLSLCSLTALLQ